MVGHGGSSAGSYLANPTSPIPSHCASIVATSTLSVNYHIFYFSVKHHSRSLYKLMIVLILDHHIHQSPCTRNFSHVNKTQAVFLYCCQDCQSCLAHLNSTGWATWVIWAAIAKYSLNNLFFNTILSTFGVAQTKPPGK